MPKRVLPQDARSKLARGLAVPGASERAVRELWNVFHDEDERISRGCFTDVVEEELGPWKQVTEPIKFATHDDNEQRIHMVNLRKCLEKLCSDSLSYREALVKAAQGTGYLTPVLYCDECTAGNVLSADKSRKSCLFYLGYLETWHLLKHEALWIPLACVQSQCINTLQGGVSRLLCHMVEQITNAEFTAGFLAHPDLMIRHQQKAFFLGDLDAVRAGFSVKGSAGLRPCILCKNVLKSHSQLVEHNSYFVEISAWTGFDRSTDIEIFQMCDRLGRCRTKAELAQEEKVLGISYDSRSLYDVK